MTNDRPIKVIVAASGSGGHLMPALYIIRAFQRIYPNSVVEFIGSGRPLEEKIIGQAAIKMHVLSVVGVKKRGIRGLLQSALGMPKAFLDCNKLFSEFKPDVVIGVGGYVTFVPVTLAALRRIPSWIHEAEIKPGLANKVLSYYATRISLAFENAELRSLHKSFYTGHPVREDLKNVSPGISAPELPKNILVLGGSQGAKALDEAIRELAPFLKEKDISIWHQCRPESVEEMKESFLKAGLVDARVDSFINDMTAAFSWSDILVTRSGAGAIMETAVVNRPTIFVPYPHGQGDHQTANAMTLVKPGKALLVKEGDNFTSRLKEALSELLLPEHYYRMKSAPYQARSLQAADAIVKGAAELIKR